MTHDKPLVDKEYLLEKFPGKGGWTYARIPEVEPDKHRHFGWVRVRGTIDNYQFSSYNLQPMGDRTLFLPVKSAIRKKIGKKEGDFVHITLFPDNLPTEIPEELTDCLKDEPEAYERFLLHTDAEQKGFIEWIYSAKSEETKADRIAQTIKKVLTRTKTH